MAIRIGKTIELRDLNAVKRAHELFTELGAMFAGGRGEAACNASEALHDAMVAFEMVEEEEVKKEDKPY